MRSNGIARIASGLVLLAVIAAGVLVLRPDAEAKYEFSAVFDNARSIVPGQLVKIAGTKIGTVDRVELTPGNKALLTFGIEERFAPFSDDATCKILPEGFVSENYVQCDPGTPGKPALRDGDGGRPTVPLARTAVSVQLQQVIDTFSLPVDERIRVVLTELGVATAARGEDFNALLRRANPALGSARKVLDILGNQKAQVGRAVAQTDGVLQELEVRDGKVRDFVASAADLTRTTSQHRAGLTASLRRMPALLREVRSSLDSIDTVSHQLTPTAADLRRSAPQLTRLSTLMPRFSTPGVPAVRALGDAVQAGRTTVREAGPTVTRLNELARDASRPVLLGRQLLENLRDVGGIEHLMNFAYILTMFSASYDNTSHLLAVEFNTNPTCIADQTAKGCVHNYDSPGQGRIPVNGTEREPADPVGREAGAAKAPGTLSPLAPQTARDMGTALDRLLNR
jgi:virulence factor Mce-like protein